MEIKGEHILFLLGAGASAEANIPMSNQMVREIEKLIKTKSEWQPYEDLYYYLKSSIHYSDGIFGKFEESFNVEKLLIVISEIEKRDKNIMHPFIGSWNIRLLDLAGNNFSKISEFKKLIRRQLNNWIKLKNYDFASYYQAFDILQGEIGELIKVFTLNYDLCFERVVGKNRIIELGFNKGEKNREWHFSNFENITGKHFYLYKLHGSIDWFMEDEKLCLSDDPFDEPELIFGIQHKMTSLDPYFYYSSKLREACLNDARLVVIIGYSYADDYVNLILSQALKAKDQLRLLNVGPFSREEKEEKELIANKLELKSTEQIIVINDFAKHFMTDTLSKDFIVSHMAEPDDVPFQ